MSQRNHYTMKEVVLSREPVELYKILKFEGLLASGGEAKFAVADGLVKVNGVVELQKRKKIVSGDVIEFDGQAFKVKLAAL
jgi:ribosome-associated protein